MLKRDQGINKIMACVPFPNCVIFFQDGFQNSLASVQCDVQCGDSDSGITA